MMLETGSQVCFQGTSHSVPEFETAKGASQSVIHRELGLANLEEVMDLLHFHLSESFAVVLCSKTPILWCYLNAIKYNKEDLLVLNTEFNSFALFFPYYHC